MISGQTLTEREYRQLSALSQSMVKEFYEDKKRFHKKYVLGEVMDEEITQPLKMGQLVDCLLLTRERFDSKFMMSVCSEAPTGLMLKFCQELAKETKNAASEDGEITESFSVLAGKAHQSSGFKWALPRVLEKFANQDPEHYYQELVQSLVNGLTVVTSEDVSIAENIVTSLRTGEFTAPLLNTEGVEYKEIHCQLAITDFAIEGRPFKGLLDRLEIDHRDKYLQPWDLKCTWGVERFFREYYLKRKGYLQTAVYDTACAYLRDEEYASYEVRPMRYIVCDTKNYYAPLVYELTAKDLVDSYTGFEFEGRKYKGLIELTQELNWHMDNNVWNMSMQNYQNQGIVKLNPTELDD